MVTNGINGERNHHKLFLGSHQLMCMSRPRSNSVFLTKSPQWENTGEKLVWSTDLNFQSIRLNEHGMTVSLTTDDLAEVTEHSVFLQGV